MRRKQCRLADFKNSFYLLIFSAKNKTVVKKKKCERVYIMPNFSSSRERECTRTAKIGPDLRLG